VHTAHCLLVPSTSRLGSDEARSRCPGIVALSSVAHYGSLVACAVPVSTVQLKRTEGAAQHYLCILVSANKAPTVLRAPSSLRDPWRNRSH
jgi:hypothetical protein